MKAFFLFIYEKNYFHFRELLTRLNMPSSGIFEKALVLDRASWVRIAVLMNVYLDLENPGGS